MLQKLAFTSLAITGLFAATVGSSSAYDMAGKKSAGGYAVVNTDGSIGGHKNVTSVSHPSTGVYDVQFKQNITACAATASIGGSTQTVAPGYIVLQRSNNVVTVNTFAVLTLVPTDFKFDLVATCSK